MEATIQTGFCGKFKLEVFKSQDDTLIKETPWFNNVVLNQGLDFMATKNLLSGVSVGTGNSTPTETQTGLDNLVASTKLDRQVSQSENSGIESNYQYYSLQRKFRFPAGAFNNVNISEVGTFCENPQYLWNRALIKDVNGQPTAITVLKDEYLQISCEIRCYRSTEDAIGSFDLVDKKGNLIKKINTTIRPVNVGRRITLLFSSALKYWFIDPNNSWQLSLKTSPIAGIDGAPSGGSWHPPSAIKHPYVDGSHQLVKSYVFGLDQANDTDYFSALLGSPSGAYCMPYQIGFDTPIRKNNQQTLTFHVVLKWGRHNVT